MSFLSRLFGRKKERARLEPLYRALVAAARAPSWYREGQVPDTVEGRFDMVAALLALVLLRLEQEGETRADSVLLIEAFIDDMDGSLRQIGIGDLVVGKQVGKLMGALGGRLQAFRQALAGGGDLEAEAARNIFHDAPVEPGALAFVAAGLKRFAAGLDAKSLDDLLAGDIGAP